MTILKGRLIAVAAIAVHLGAGLASTLAQTKVNPDKLDPAPAETFRSLCPQGSNYVVTPRVPEPYRIRRRGLVFTVCTTGHLQAV